MFGQFTVRRDQDLVAAKDPQAAQLFYARELLAEVLNRASILGEGPYWVAFERHLRSEERRPVDPEYVSALENLAGAVRLFLEDCDEARVRARRARLVCPDLQTAALVRTDSVEPDEDLAEIGGPLIADPEAGA